MRTVSHRPRKPSLPNQRDIFSGIQPDLFQRLAAPSRLDSPNAGDMDIGPELRGAMHSVLRLAKERGLTRERVIDRMNLALPDLAKRITKRQLDSWMAESKEFHEFPFRFVAAFCWATGSAEPLLVLTRTLGFDLVDARDSAALELGEAQVAMARLRRKTSVLTRTLEGEL